MGAKIEKDQILQVLSKVQDPLTGRDIVSTGRIRSLDVDEKLVKCTLVYTENLAQEQKSSLHFACISAVEQNFPGAQMHVHLETQIRQGEAPRSILPQVREIIAVGSGKGGVGKSTVSVNLALALQEQGYRVGILDADLYGPSIPKMLGLEGMRPKIKDVHGKAKIVPLEAFGMPVISMGFIVDADQAVVLRGPRLAGILKQFLQDCLWPALDFLIIDLPPGTGDIQLTLVQTVPLTGAVLVTTPQQVAVADAIKAMNMFRLPSIDVPILGVVENMAWFTPAELPENRYYLFGQGAGRQLAQLGEAEMLGQIPIIQSVMESGEKGVPAVVNKETDGKEVERWMALGQSLIKQVEIRNTTKDPTKIVGIKS